MKIKKILAAVYLHLEKNIPSEMLEIIIKNDLSIKEFFIPYILKGLEGITYNEQPLQYYIPVQTSFDENEVPFDIMIKYNFRQYYIILRHQSKIGLSDACGNYIYCMLFTPKLKCTPVINEKIISNNPGLKYWKISCPIPPLKQNQLLGMAILTKKGRKRGNYKHVIK